MGNDILNCASLQNVSESGWPDDLEKNCPIFWKVAKTVDKQNNAKLETIFKQVI